MLLRHTASGKTEEETRCGDVRPIQKTFRFRAYCPLTSLGRVCILVVSPVGRGVWRRGLTEDAFRPELILCRTDREKDLRFGGGYFSVIFDNSVVI